MSSSLPPHAQLAPLGHDQARWADGFWAEVLTRTSTATVPQMWDSLKDPAISPAIRNFEIALGQADGEHEGPPFMDGDLYKWMEAAISSLEYAPNPDLLATIERIAEMIVAAQREDGYLHTATLIAAKDGAVELADRYHFETYNLGHLITMSVRHHRLTGSDVLLDVAKRAAAFLTGLAQNKPLELARSAICPSHYMAVIDLYRATGDAQYLRLAERFLQVRDDFEGGDDNQDRLPVREQTVAAGHAVRANYLYAGLADLVAETGDAGLLATLETLWSDVADTKLYLTGGCGALYDGASPDATPWQGTISRVHQAYGRAFQLPNTTAHNESCANIGMIFWSERMLALTGDAKYADVIEQISYNALLASLSLAGTEYFYTNPLRQVRDLPYPLRMPGDTALSPVPAPPASDERFREAYLSCFCCPPNIARTLAQFHERVASISAAGVFIHQYGGSRISVSDGDRSLELVEDSNYPWSPEVTFTVTAATGGGLPLHVRIPGWAEGATVTVNGTPVPTPVAGTYLRVADQLTAGDVVALALPMPVRVLRGNRLAEEITNQVAVQRGPIVYCLESPDVDAGIPLEQLAWRRGTALTPTTATVAGAEVTVLTTELTVLPPTPAGLYDDLPEADLGTTPARLVPYYTWGNRGRSEMSVWVPVVW